MKSFVLTPLAEEDLAGIWDHIAEDNLEAATRVLKSLESTIARLAKKPTLGHWREELADKSTGFFSFIPTLIVYRTETDPLQIIRVLHAARDVRTLLGSPTEHL